MNIREKKHTHNENISAVFYLSLLLRKRKNLHQITDYFMAINCFDATRCF